MSKTSGIVKACMVCGLMGCDLIEYGLCPVCATSINEADDFGDKHFKLTNGAKVNVKHPHHHASIREIKISECEFKHGEDNALMKVDYSDNNVNRLRCTECGLVVVLPKKAETLREMLSFPGGEKDEKAQD